jgi:hypothetical protein
VAHQRLSLFDFFKLSGQDMGKTQKPKQPCDCTGVKIYLIDEAK